MRTKLFLSLAVGLLLAVTGSSQSNTNSLPPINGGTNLVGVIGVDGFVTQIWDTMVGEGLTNLSATIYGTYTPSLHKWGEGVVLMRNINLGGGFGTGIGVGVDNYDSQFYALNAQATLNARTAPFGAWGGFWTNVIVTPFAGLALGTPFGSGAGSASGNLETIEFTGASLHLFTALGADWGLDGIYGSRSGLGSASGVFYGGGLTALWRF